MYPRFVTRTINDGKVKIYGREFYPSEQWMKYDGRLDGLRYIFGLYQIGEKLEDFVFLWGPEDKDFGPEVVDSKLDWAWWNVRKND